MTWGVRIRWHQCIPGEPEHETWFEGQGMTPVAYPTREAARAAARSYRGMPWVVRAYAARFAEEPG